MKRTHSKRYWILLSLIIAIGIVIVAFFIFRTVTQSFTNSEIQSRDDWNIAAGSYTNTNEDQQISIYTAPCEASINVEQILPNEYKSEGFTYYDTSVQDRLAQTLLQMINRENYTLNNPLAVLNPFGTGSNGLYLYFSTDHDCQIRYTIQTNGYSDYSNIANNRSGYSRSQEFLLIGLIPGETNNVTLEAINRQGETIDSTSFSITMPETTSGYATQLSYTDGNSTTALSDGLYYAMGLGDYYGYTFFFDNEGVLRYEMVLEGYHSDRFLMDGNELLTFVGSHKLARISRLGQVVQVYDLGKYELHHDINTGSDGKVLALATDTESATTEDRIIEIDLESGDVTELVDFSQLLYDYFITTTPVSATDSFFWQEGEWDWLHLNSLSYTSDGGVIVSSRETSTIIKVSDIESSPSIEWFIGDSAFWEGTPYANKCLTQEGDFLLQYGQHDVEVITDDSLPEGQYYLRMFNNNYWVNSTRDGYEPTLSDQVGLSMTDGTGVSSYVYYYLVDESNGTFSLTHSFEVPYSSLVSNVQDIGETYVIDSGVAKCYGEYDSTGNLIREFTYDCMMNGYRVMKSNFNGYWFIQS